MSTKSGELQRGCVVKKTKKSRSSVVSVGSSKFVESSLLAVMFSVLSVFLWLNRSDKLLNERE